MVYAAFMRNN